MAKAPIDLNNFRLVKFGNTDIERDYNNDILHAIVAKLDSMQDQINQIIGSGTGGSGNSAATYVTLEPELSLPNSAVLQGEPGVVDIINNTSTVEIDIAAGGISTTKLADDSVTIPKIDASGTADDTTFLRGDGQWVAISGGDLHFVFTQSTAASSWTIVHNLNKFPSVTIEDTGGNDIEGEIVYDNSNQITLNFSSAFAGTAYLN